MANNRPIGIFDSGLGGLSIWKEVVKTLPKESLIYFADSGNCPYGIRSKEEIRKFSTRIVDFFVVQKCKMVIVACNTATGAAIDFLREKFDLPFVGLEPAVKPAAINSKTGHIGILATKGTLESKLFNKTKNRFADNVEVHLQIGKGLVELVENGLESTPEAEQLLRKYLLPMLENEVDQIVLGCTHYPFLIPKIQQIVGDSATILNPAPAVALQAARLLLERDIACSSNHNAQYSFFTSGIEKPMINLIKRITDRSNSVKKMHL